MPNNIILQKQKAVQAYKDEKIMENVRLSSQITGSQNIRIISCKNICIAIDEAQYKGDS